MPEANPPSHESEPLSLERPGPSRTLRVETAGRGDPRREGPYQSLYWHEGRRTGFPWPTGWWAFDGAGVVAAPDSDDPNAIAAAAAAVDAVRGALALPMEGQSPAPPPVARPERRLRDAIERANEVIRNRAVASRDARTPSTCSLVAAIVDGDEMLLAWVGDCAAYLVGAQGCRRLTETPESESGADAPTRLGERGHVRPRVAGLTVSSGEIAVLLSAEAAAVLASAEDLPRLVGDTASLEEFCERLVLESAIAGRGAGGSAVALGFDLRPDSPLFVDPSRDALPLGMALRVAALPPRGGRDPASDARGLLRSAQAGAFWENALPSAAAPAMLTPAEPLVATPGAFEPPLPHSARTVPETLAAPLRYRPSEQARKLPRWPIWAAAAVAVVVAAVFLGRERLPEAYDRLAAAFSSSAPPSATTLTQPEPAPEPLPPSESASPESDAPMDGVRAGDYHLRLRPLRTCVMAELNADAPTGLVLVLQRQGDDGAWSDKARITLAESESAAVPIPEHLYGTVFGNVHEIALHLVREDDGSLVWGPEASLASLPRNSSVSIQDTTVYLADRASALLLVVRPPDVGNPPAAGESTEDGENGAPESAAEPESPPPPLTETAE